MFGMKSKEEQLIDAARNGDTKKVKSLIDKGADIEAKDDDGCTALTVFAKCGHKAAVELLLNKGADIEATDNDGWTVLMHAAKEGKTETVELLLNKGAAIEATTNKGGTALIIAAANGHLNCVKKLIEAGTNMHTKNKAGKTALMRAEEEGHKEIVKYLKSCAAGQGSKDLPVIKKVAVQKDKIDVDDEPARAELIEAKGELTITKDIMSDVIMFYTFTASWEVPNEEIFPQRMNKVVEKLSEWQLEGIMSMDDLTNACQEAYDRMHEEEKKSEDSALDMFRKCAQRIKKHFPNDQLEIIIRDIQEIVIDASEREMAGIKDIAENFGVDFKIDKGTHKKAVVRSTETKDKKSKSNFQLIYETNAAPCNNTMLSLIFSRRRLAEMGIIEPADDYEYYFDLDSALNKDIVNSMIDDIKATGKIPFLVFDDEDDESAWQSDVYLFNPSGDTTYFKDIYESLDYSSKRGPFFFGTYFMINDTFETTIIFTQDGFIGFHPVKKEWTILRWESWKGTELVKKGDSPEPVIHLLAGDGEPNLYLSSEKYDNSQKVYQHQSVILLMKEILDQFWECVEVNRNSATQSIPMDKFRFITSENIGDYAVEILNKAGIKCAGPTKTKATAEKHKKNVNADLMKAVFGSETETVESLLDKGADIETKNDIGNTPLLVAAIKCDIKTIKLLLDKGADIEAKENNGLTALMCAACFGYNEITELLINKGADIEAEDKIGQTALMQAAEEGKTETVELLISKGANIEACDNNGNKVLIHASGMGQTEAAELLVNKGADIEWENYEGFTALIMAAYHGHTETVTMLIDKGANIEAEDDDGKTALSIAMKEGHKETVKALKKAVAARGSKDSPANRKTAEQKVETAGDEEEASIAGNLNSGKWPPLQGELLERFINGNSKSVQKVPDLSLWSEGVFKGSGVQDCAGKILSMMFMTMKEKEAHAFFNDLMKHLDKQRGGKTKEEKTKIDLYYPITREWLELAYKTRKAFSNIVNKFYDKYSIDDVVDCASIDQEEQVNAMGFDYSQKEDETDIFIIMRDPKTESKEMFEISLIKSNKELKLSALCRNTIYLISSENDEIREYVPDENEQPKGHLNSSESGDVSEQQEDEAPAKGKKIKYANWPEFEKEQSAKGPQKKSFMPIAKNVHDLITSAFNENKMPFEVRYGDGTFSFYVPEELAQSRMRTCARFGLVSLRKDKCYIESLLKDADDKLPEGAIQFKKDDPTHYGYRFASPDDFEKVKKDMKAGIVRSYKILAK